MKIKLLFSFIVILHPPSAKQKSNLTQRGQRKKRPWMNTTQLLSTMKIRGTVWLLLTFTIKSLKSQCLVMYSWYYQEQAVLTCCLVRSWKVPWSCQNEIKGYWYPRGGLWYCQYSWEQRAKSWDGQAHWKIINRNLHLEIRRTGQIWTWIFLEVIRKCSSYSPEIWRKIELGKDIS